MSHQHIVQTVRHVLPDGQGKNSLLQIEGCGIGRGIVDDGEILVRQETSENGLGFGVRVAHAYIIPQIRSKTTLRSVKPPILTDFLRIFRPDPIKILKIFRFFPFFPLTNGFLVVFAYAGARSFYSGGSEKLFFVVSPVIPRV